MSNDLLLNVGDPAPDLTLPDDQGQPVRLSDRWRHGPISLVFVRHSGCTLCRGHADALRNFYPQIQAAGGDVLLVTMNEPEKLATFKKQLQLPFTCLADPQQAAYRAYQCPRGSWWSVLGPAMWWRATWMLFKHGLGKPLGDVRQLPGSFVIDRQGTIRFVHRSQHSADWASPDELVRTLSAICVETQPLAAG